MRDRYEDGNLLLVLIKSSVTRTSVLSVTFPSHFTPPTHIQIWGSGNKEMGYWPLVISSNVVILGKWGRRNETITTPCIDMHGDCVRTMEWHVRRHQLTSDSCMWHLTVVDKHRLLLITFPNWELLLTSDRRDWGRRRTFGIKTAEPYKWSKTTIICQGFASFCSIDFSSPSNIQSN